FADSLRERRGLVVRHPDYRSIHPRLKPWLSAVGVKRKKVFYCLWSFVYLYFERIFCVIMINA
ncbi:MAG: hypothetical protein JXA79_10560, partial [Deltaproteobacteria bacterium]|nr:hypothetical protein [Deltaproteobacteria bacterium]